MNLLDFRNTYNSVADTGEGPGESPHPLFLDQNEAWRGRKEVLETAPSLISGLGTSGSGTVIYLLAITFNDLKIVNTIVWQTDSC